MKEYVAYPVLCEMPEGYHFESPAVAGNRFCWSQIHRTPEPRCPGAVHWFTIPADGFSEEGLKLDVTTIPFDEPVPGIMPTSDPGKVIVAKERTLHLLDLDEPADVENLPQVGDVIDTNPDVRLNDCQAGFDGLPYVGTMAYDCETPLGKWGPVLPDGTFKPLIEGVKISNGFDWTEPVDGVRNLVYVDSKSGKVDDKEPEEEFTESSEVWRFSHDPEGEGLGEKEVLVNLTPYAIQQLKGCPVVGDGGKMAFDDSGKPFFIVMEYNGGGGHIIDAETGEVVARINVPALKPTSCCWVGDVLLITTTKEGLHETDRDALSEEQQKMYDLSGHLFWCKPEGLHGRPPFTVKL